MCQALFEKNCDLGEIDMKDKQRTILHIDFNNFYASVESSLDPELKKHPIAVCGSQEDRHGIVLAKNYAAKACGVATGEVIWQAKQKCRDLVIVQPHYDEYMKYSRLGREIYERYTDQIEPYGMDEVWADVTGSTRLFGDGEHIAEEIRETVKRELGLTVSIGVSFNKIFAKLGSDMKKPDAVTVIPEETFREKIWDLPAKEMLGVGPSTYRKLVSSGVTTIGRLAEWPMESLVAKFGVRGKDLWLCANGYDHSPVTKRNTEALDKTAGHGMTALQDLESSAEVWPFILELSQEIGHRLMTFRKRACGVAISVKDKDLMSCQWQCPLNIPTQSPSYIAKSAFSLFQKRYDWHKPIRAMTVRAIELASLDKSYQLNMMENASRIDRQEALDYAVDDLRRRFGNNIIRNAVLLNGNTKYPGHDNPKLIMPTGLPC